MKLIGTSKKFEDVEFYQTEIIADNRGFFQKPFFGDLINEKFNNNYEVLVSHSKKNVIRGLHFQLPPNDVDKVVYCLEGKILDVFVDLRSKSKTFGFHDSKVLEEKIPNSILVPKGFAHGFSVISDTATVLYLQSKPFNKDSDSGIHYDSVNIDWNIKNPIISQKDKNLTDLTNFKTPWK
jgi:dTDP-4-dehydrorhamnose 3,5-epimerase